MHVYWIRDTQILVMAVDDEVVHELAAAPLRWSRGASKGKPAKQHQNIYSERVQSSAPQSHSASNPVGTGTQQDTLPFLPLEILKGPYT